MPHHSDDTRVTHAGSSTGDDPRIAPSSAWLVEDDDLFDDEAFALADIDPEFDLDGENAWRAQGRATGENILSFARANPVATALAGAGIALLLSPRPNRDDARTAYRVARDRGSAALDTARDRGSAALDTARDRGSAALDESSRRVRDRLGSQEKRMRKRLQRMRDTVAEGTADLGEDARDRVIAARLRTIAAREQALDHATRLRRRADDAARRGASQASSSVREHPLLAAALAVAAGAALGAALPRTRTEDRRLGGFADRLRREAQDIYDRERDLILGGARGAWEEARSMAAERAQSARAAMPDGGEAAESMDTHVRRTADRLAEGVRKGANGA